MPNKRRQLTGIGADVFFKSTEAAEQLHSETVQQFHSQPDPAPTNDQVIKTSFYPRQDQLDKLDDLAAEYNKKYRRQRKRIDRQDIMRFLIDTCTLEALSDLQ